QLKIDELTVKLAEKDAGNTSASDVVLKDVKLYQNAPNPFNQTTEIKYYLPQTVKKAFIAIYDLNGKQLKYYDIPQHGDGSVTVQAEELVPGMYLYSLVVEGREADTKRMVLSK
ncbi:MAG: T9SS type A sorting domain-containing protein, partial [Taibaiella sp.]|nr:T9SS type A sorting domain-containing protein [Taibaiella sp.]